jgi:hypothetical protein
MSDGREGRRLSDGLERRREVLEVVGRSCESGVCLSAKMEELMKQRRSRRRFDLVSLLRRLGGEVDLGRDAAWRFRSITQGETPHW